MLRNTTAVADGNMTTFTIVQFMKCYESAPAESQMPVESQYDEYAPSRPGLLHASPSHHLPPVRLPEKPFQLYFDKNSQKFWELSVWRF